MQTPEEFLDELDESSREKALRMIAARDAEIRREERAEVLNGFLDAFKEAVRQMEEITRARTEADKAVEPAGINDDPMAW